MKKLVYTLFIVGMLFATALSAIAAEVRIKAAEVEAGYRQYRDTALGCQDCWTAGIPFTAVLTYNTSFYKTGNESCSTSGDTRVCYYEYNIDGVNQYLR